MHYCFRCDLAGYISYEWNGKVACFNCGNELEEKSYEWIKSQGVTVISGVQYKEYSEPYP